MILYYLREAIKLRETRKCRNWQTSKTKDLVAIAVVWVQVPSSAVKKKASGGNLRLFFFRTEASLEPKVQGLRFAPVGAKPRSTGPRAPHLPQEIRVPQLSGYSMYGYEESLEPKVQGLLAINGSSVGSVGKRSAGPFSACTFRCTFPPHPIFRKCLPCFLYKGFCSIRLCNHGNN